MVRNHILGLAVVLLTGVATAQRVGVKKMDMVISSANATTCGHDYSHASAFVLTQERGMETGVRFIIRGVKPNQLHSIWLRLASPSPLTSAPVTPLAPTWGIQTIINNANTTVQSAMQSAVPVP